MWSFGCILFELIQFTIKTGTSKEFSNDRYLFKGKSCFPLTPIDKKNDDLEMDGVTDGVVGQHDQMNVILRGLGV